MKFSGQDHVVGAQESSGVEDLAVEETLQEVLKVSMLWGPGVCFGLPGKSIAHSGTAPAPAALPWRHLDSSVNAASLLWSRCFPSREGLASNSNSGPLSLETVSSQHGACSELRGWPSLDLRRSGRAEIGEDLLPEVETTQTAGAPVP